MVTSRRDVVAAGGMAAMLAVSPRPAVAAATTTNAMDTTAPVFELRQYTLKGGRRDAFIALFEERFVESQEATGIRLVGLFRDLDDPDRFVWMRAFADMTARKRALTEFYASPTWKANRDAANASIVDSDNVLLLRATGDPFTSVRDGASGVYTARIHALASVDGAAFTRLFDEVVAPLIAACGAEPIARFATEGAPNDFPGLPIREHEPVFVWFARFDDEAAERAFAHRFSTRSGWRDRIPDPLLPSFMRKPELLRLTPTTRSALR